MSCFAYMPGLYTLDYWHEKYKGKNGHKRFLLTKLVEITSFKWGHRAHTAPRRKERPTFPSLKKGNGMPDDPKVCVVVPCFMRSLNDQRVLERLLDSLMAQHMLAEVILVDDASPLPVSARHGEKILRSDRNQGPAAARNAGITIALNRGADMVAFTDMDCIPDAAWLSTLCDALKKDPSAHVASGCTHSAGTSWLDRYHDMNGTLNGRLYEGRKRLLYGTTCNLALSATAMRSVKFNEKFSLPAGEDIEFCYRLNQAGYNINFIESAVVAHDYFYKSESVADQWKLFIRQFRKYAKGEKQLLKIIPDYYEYYAHSEGIAVPEKYHE